MVERLRDEAALSSTYNKGLALARGGAVAKLDFIVGSIGSTVSLSGSVEGSHGARYRTEVQIDASDDEILDYSCTCLAAANYAGMCKHEIALVLEYLARNGMGPVLAARPAPVAAATWAPAPRAHAQAPTSPQVSELMESLVSRRLDRADAARYMRPHDDGGRIEPVDLAVTLSTGRDSYYGDRSWCIKLSVRRGSVRYVVKNIAALVDAWRAGSTVVYGKNLTCVHVPEAFTGRAAALIDIVTRVVSSQQALFLSRWKYQEAGRGTDIKDLPVSDADLIDILDVLQGAEITFEPDDGPYGTRGKARRMVVTSGDPEPTARLEPALDGGYDLRVDGASYCFAAASRMYVTDEHAFLRCTPDYARRASSLLPRLLPCRTKLHIAPGDLPAFCRDALPIMREVMSLDAPEALDALAPPEAAFTFKIGLDCGRVSCDVKVAYGSWEARLYGSGPRELVPAFGGARDGASVAPARDLAAEYRAMEAVEAYFPGGRIERGELPGFDEDDDERLYDLLCRGLVELDGLGEVLLSERLRAIEVRDSPNLTVRATVTSGLLDVAVDTSGLSPRDLAAYLASYKRKQKFVRLSNGDIMRLGEGASALGDLADGLGVDTRALAEGVHGLSANRVLFIDGLAKRARGMRLARNDAFRAIVRDFDTYADADYRVPATLAGVLRPYQRDGFRWLEMLERFGFGGILADDMGLGKTLQVIAHILARRQADAAEGGASSPTLVVCPASLVYNWMSELARFAPELDAAAVLGPKAARRRIIEGAAEHDVIVTSYDLMKRDVDEYAGIVFARVVLDEAQYIKNPATQAARAAKRLEARVRFALTGTPIENRTSELWSIFDFLMPGVLGTRDAFAKAYEGPVEGGDARATERLRCLVAPFILRRLKADVLADLPQKTESVVRARMAGEQDKLYRANQDRLARQIVHEMPAEFRAGKLEVLAELTRLRQICCDPSLAFENYEGGSAKLDTCMELVASALDGGHSVLLFSQFTTMLDIIARRLAEAGVRHFMLTGSTSKEERRRLVERFQAGEAPVFLISLRAGGVGLNLTAADVVIHYDPWWNLAAQNQATDRAYRIGQERAVSVYKLICADTIEERILSMQESKRELAEGLLSGEGVRSTELTRDDVLALLSSGR